LSYASCDELALRQIDASGPPFKIGRAVVAPLPIFTNARSLGSSY
jgi:hypothetical protein